MRDQLVTSPLVYSRSDFRLAVSAELWQSLLVELANIRWPKPVELEGEDAIVLDGGMGPAWLLTRSGVLFAHWDEPLAVTLADAHRAIVVGWSRTNVGALLLLLPPRPAGASDCDRCSGTRFCALNPGAAPSNQFSIVCDRCDGVSWLSADLAAMQTNLRW